MDEAARLRILVKAQADEIEWRRAQDKQQRHLRDLIYKLSARVSDLEVALRNAPTQALPILPRTDRFRNGG